MKTKVVLVSAAALLTLPLPAQVIRPEEAQNRTFGWMRIYSLTPPAKPLTVDHRVYSIAQLTMADRFASWMQQSYVPVGGLGDVLRTVSDRLSAYNQITTSLPQSYGAYAKIYTELRYGKTGKIEPVSNSHVVWTVKANEVYGQRAINFSTPEQYYFTLPTFEQQGFGPELERAVDLSQHPVLRQFPQYFFRDSVTGNRKYVLLSRDGRLPFVKLTRGEYLDALGTAIAHQYERERRRITEAEQGDKVRIARAMTFYDERQAKRLAALATHRATYQGRLQEVAEIDSVEPDLALEHMEDAFLRSKSNRLRLPVYKVDPVLAAAAKTGGPQWVVVSWTAQLNDPVVKRLHDAILNNFNFEYVRDFVFAPEKVTGRGYTPLRDPAAVETVATAAPSAARIARAADPNVHFFDDFSTTPIGKPPVGWTSTLNNAGASSVVTAIEGIEGRWMATTGWTLTPTQLKTPLPPDFTITYDLVASENYTWGARGMTFRIATALDTGNPASFISLRLRPGSGSAAGEAVLEAEFLKTSGYLSGSKWFVVPGFSNKSQATAAVMIVKQGERLQVFLNKTMVLDVEKAVPAGLRFNAVSLHHGGTFNPADRMFIGNLTILKK
jgi:hypothetical protein